MFGVLQSDPSKGGGRVSGFQSVMKSVEGIARLKIESIANQALGDMVLFNADVPAQYHCTHRQSRISSSSRSHPC